MAFYAYIVRCADGTFYTGWTDDIAARVRKHNEGKGARYTRGRAPVELAAQWEFTNKSDAMSFEWHVKRLTRQQKEKLISGDVCGLSGRAMLPVSGSRVATSAAS